MSAVRGGTADSENPKVVAITGVTSGIGRGVAKLFTERGCIVFGTGRRTHLGVELESELRASNGQFTFVQSNVTERDQCVRFIDTVVEGHRQLDVLINNAGGPGDPAIIPTEEVTESQWHEVISLNLSATFFCCQEAIKQMKTQQRGGVILNVASTQAVEAIAQMAAYNSAKAAVVQLSRTLAVEYLSDYIRVNALLMGGAATDASASVMRDLRHAMGKEESDPTGMARLPRPLHAMRTEHIGAAMYALSMDDSMLITGATISLDRAMSAGSMTSEAIRLAMSGNWPGND
jgi:NAD(P)-dependent dehydrogenase (short-subunit alcohol dehydrogenase family)